MIKIENHCCDCAAPGYPCLGKFCSNMNVEVYYCDECKEEISGDIYRVDGEEHLCEYCVLNKTKLDI